MSKEELFEKLSRTGYAAQLEDVNNATFEELAYCYEKLKLPAQTDAVKKKNLQMVIGGMRYFLEEDRDLFYVAMPSGMPYQYSSNFRKKPIDTDNIEMRVFDDYDDATEEAAAVFEKLNRATGNRVPSHAFEGAKLRVFDSMTNIECLRQFDTKVLIIGESAIRIPLSTILPPAEEINENSPTQAPRSRALFGVFEQAVFENRDTQTKDTLLDMIAQELPYNSLFYVVDLDSFHDSDLVPILYQDDEENTTYLDAFTDIVQASFEKNDGLDGCILIPLSWTEMARMDMPVLVNRLLPYDVDEIRHMCVMHKDFLLAGQYITNNYGIDPQTELGISRVISIMYDIYDAEPVWDEFVSCLIPTDDESQPLFMTPAKDDNLVRAYGISATDCMDFGICKTPAHAYHVLAQLFNDKDGSAKAMFDKAELYE